MSRVNAALEKGEKRRENLPESNSKTPKSTVPRATTHPTVSEDNSLANCIIPLRFVTQHVIDKKLVLSLTQLYPASTAMSKLFSNHVREPRTAPGDQP